MNIDTVALFKALSDRTRIRLMNILLHHELGVNDLVSILQTGQSGISRHLGILTAAGLLRCRRDGVWAYYSAAANGAGQRFLHAVSYLFDEDMQLSSDLGEAVRLMEESRQRRRNYFNAIAADWDRLKREILGECDLNGLILDHLGNHYDVALDLGCGTGELMAALRSRADRIIGVDSSTRMLQEARRRFGEADGAVDLRLGELEHLPVGNTEVDLAVIAMTMHHLESPAAAIAEVARVLRPGGEFVVVDFAKHEDESLRRKYGFRWLGFTPAEIHGWLERHGFRVRREARRKLNNALFLNMYTAEKIT
ncbi:MAG: metalloregulator ArsR/SmtB family transcription factor [Acidobacteria bacterium]|nr:metalloregulator ArsR/SmtB family transcription factor [Acidobacteriota bacterium]